MIGLDLGLWCGQATSFNPLSFSPALWLDASDASTLFQSNGGAAASADGDPVGYWLDKSGNNNHATQTSGSNKPTLKTAIQNSKNIVRANGTSSRMTFTGINILFPYTYYFVYKKSSTGAKFETLGNQSSNATYSLESFSDNIIYGFQKISGTSNSFWKTVSVFNDYANFVSMISSSDGTIGSLYNKTNVVPIQNNGSANYTSVYTSLLFADGSWANGDLAEVFIFNTQHDATQRTNMQNYLVSKWGIY
jgi:hypothetical protein